MSAIFDALSRLDRPNTSRGAAGGGAAVMGAPSEDHPETVSAKSFVPAARNGRERRKQKRTSIKLAARIRPADPRNGKFEEILIALNASRESLYFITASEHYHLGMRLRVTFPYSSPHDRAGASEDDGEVKRMERLADKRVGVAVQLRGPAQTAGHSVYKGAVGERRLNPRVAFSAGAVVVDSHADMRVEARCSDLSLGGCYVDTLNPLPEGTLAQIYLRRAGEVFEAAARVRSSHSGMGMGLGFQELTSQQTSMLVHWLNGGQGDVLLVANSSEIGTRAQPMDRAMAINWIRQIVSESFLTKDDVMAVFSDSVL